MEKNKIEIVYVIAELKGMQQRYITENDIGVCERGPFVGTIYSLHYDIATAKRFDTDQLAENFIQDFIIPFLPDDEIAIFFFEVKKIFVYNSMLTGIKLTREHVNKIRAEKGREPI